MKELEELEGRNSQNCTWFMAFLGYCSGFQDLLRLMRRVTEHLLSGRERLKREVGEVMGGKVLELPTDKLCEEGETGRAEGRMEYRKAVPVTIYNYM